MPTYSYQALTKVGELVSGSIEAPSAAEVARRIEFLGLIPIDAVAEEKRGAAEGRRALALFGRPRAEDVTLFAADLALLLRAGMRINDALELIAADPDLGRMRAVAASLARGVLAGESFADALGAQPAVFPAVFVALTKVGETSGALAPALDAIAAERQRAEALRRRLGDALRYPAFLLLAAGGVLIFFLTVVLPQFVGVFRDFNAKLDPMLTTALAISEILRAHAREGVVALLLVALATLLASRRPETRRALLGLAARAPIARSAMNAHRAALFCRNLGLLLGAGVPLAAALRILADMMSLTGSPVDWSAIVEKVRHGGRLSEALAAAEALPAMAVRTLRLGEESNQLATLAQRIAEFYEAKLQRNLDRLIGVVGPLAIIVISLIVGGLIVSVMTTLLSVNQVVG